MTRMAWTVAAAALMACGWAGGEAIAEDLEQAWSIALGANDRLRAQEFQTRSAGHEARAARSARLGSVSNVTLDLQRFSAGLTGGSISPTASVAPPGGTGRDSGLSASTGGAFGLIAPGQFNVPVTSNQVSFPIFTGGQLINDQKAADARVGAARADESQAAQDLKLTVATAYVDVLRARRAMEVAVSNVGRLDSFLRDVKNRRETGVALRNDELSAEVQLAAAVQRRISARRDVEVAHVTYNRYLCRPPSAPVDLEDLVVDPKSFSVAERAAQALDAGDDVAEAESMVAEAVQGRPDLRSLSEQARNYAARAKAQRGASLPQVNLSLSHTFIGVNEGLGEQNYLIGSAFATWNMFDYGTTRNRTEALRSQAQAALRRRADAAADVAVEVRSRWLDLQEAKTRVPVARVAVTQSEENIRVVVDRYREGISIYTEVLDAENARIQSYNDLYDANYDAALAGYRLRRAVGAL